MAARRSEPAGEAGKDGWHATDEVRLALLPWPQPELYATGPPPHGRYSYGCG